MNKTIFQFGSPLFFLLIFLLPFIYRVLFRGRNLARLRFSSSQLFDHVGSSPRERLKFVPSLLRVLCLLFLIIALARPQLGNKTTEVLSEGIDIMLTIDTSGSMKALDFHLKGALNSYTDTNRLDVIKGVVEKFIARRSYDRIGMIVFGEQAYTQCPLTLDKGVLDSFLKWIHIGIAGDGTAIGNALAVSVKRIKDQPTKSKIIILLTDGRNNAGEIDPIRAAELAKENHIKIYTIGVGTRGPVPYPQETPFGIQKVYAQLDLDEDTLKQIAETTGGEYFRATQTEELEKIYDTIDKLEKTEIKVKEYSDYHELYAGFLLAGLLLLIAEVLLSNTVFVRLP